MPNRLALESSPYLRQHQDNPVDWYPWGEEAFERARAEDRPILLSIGYATCHWCHVMAHESFENPLIAERMNALFVCVKVDREERPDVDRIYMAAVQAMSGSGGWPMTVFLRPDGKPFYAGTYYPPEDRYGRPGFPRLLGAVHDAWMHKRGDLDSSAEHLARTVQEMGRRSGRRGELQEAHAARALENLAARFDAVHGGFGDAPKFPAPTTLEFLLQHFRRTGDRQALEMALFTLEKMALSGLYDQLGGGFHRYSVDQRWAVPHFEKMLYDNAQLVRVYLHAIQLLREGTISDQRSAVSKAPEPSSPHPTARSALFTRVVRETLGYLEREMRSSSGGFYSAQDADSEGIEGKFFTWTPDEVREVLGEDAPLLIEYFGVTDAGNFLDPHHPEFGSRTVLSVPHPSLLELRQDLAPEPKARAYAALERGRQKLWEAREQRVHPGTDDKVLTSWNGLALAAFAEAARVLQDGPFLEIALENAQFFWAHMRAGGGRMLHTHREGQGKITGLLEDLALYGLGLLELYKACGDLKWLEWARELYSTAVRDHWDEASGTFLSTAHDSETLIARMAEFFDAAVLSDNASSALLGLHLDRYFGDSAAQGRSEQVVLGSLGEMLRAASGFGGLWQGYTLLLSERTEIVLMGSAGARAPFERTLADHYLPFTALAPAEREDARLPLLEGRGGEGVAYVCRNLACNLPVHTPEGLREQILESLAFRV